MKNLDRRTLLKGATLASGVAAFAPQLPASVAADPIAKVPGAPLIVAKGSGSVVETTAGKVSGYVRNGIVTFKGIPYAGPVGGERRFLAPIKAAPWTGVRSSMYYGQVCPQGPRAGWAEDENAFMFEWDDGQPGEDCLRVNVWTPAVNDHKKRPVMFWIHGGGYSAGSGQELKSYDGENLSKRGDVVVVSVNHRLNAFGYLNLIEHGEKWANSANAGMLDLIAALEWVHDNIAGFGGDPGNVTIFGQSGGGGKVGTLMAMPAAQGLFHRAAIESGSSLRQAPPENSAKLAAAVLSELGLGASQVEQLQRVSTAQLIAASVAAVRKLAPPGGNFPGSGMGINWGPTVDGKTLPTHSFDPAAPAMSAKVPLLVGTVLNEFTNGIAHPEYEAMTEEEMKRRATARFGDKSTRIIAAFRTAHPAAKPFDLLSLMMAAPVRQNAVTQATRKAELNAAPAYLYWFTWQTPILDGRPRAFHCCELPFVFYNTDRCAAMTGGTAEARELGGRVADAWINFARKGDPNHPGLPKWPVFDAKQEATMIFDKVCQVKQHPDREERGSLA
jgi:para-nitrobenzyl esterase